jgi:hypothetical protein
LAHEVERQLAQLHGHSLVSLETMLIRRLHRGCLALLTVTGAFVGGWAYFAPLNWYDTFPGLGMHWLPVLGPFNEHFAKDVGAMYLALGALAAAAFVVVDNVALRIATAISWTVFNALHLSYHVTMLHMYGTRDAVLNAVALTLFLAASAALLFPWSANYVRAEADSTSIG